MVSHVTGNSNREITCCFAHLIIHLPVMNPSAINGKNLNFLGGKGSGHLGSFRLRTSSLNNVRIP